MYLKKNERVTIYIIKMKKLSEKSVFHVVELFHLIYHKYTSIKKKLMAGMLLKVKKYFFSRKNLNLKTL